MFYATNKCSRTSTSRTITMKPSHSLAFAVRRVSSLPFPGLRVGLASARVSPGPAISSAGPAGTIWASDVFRAGPATHSFSLGRSSSATGGTRLGLSTTDTDEVDDTTPPPPRIAIIGGGIAGVTAARSIARELATDSKSMVKRAQIDIYEG